MDYCMPARDRHAGLPYRDVIVPATTNPLGVKGARRSRHHASLAAS